MFTFYVNKEILLLRFLYKYCKSPTLLKKKKTFARMSDRCCGWWCLLWTYSLRKMRSVPLQSAVFILRTDIRKTYLEKKKKKKQPAGHCSKGLCMQKQFHIKLHYLIFLFYFFLFHFVISFYKWWRKHNSKSWVPASCSSYYNTYVTVLSPKIFFSIKCGSDESQQSKLSRIRGHLKPKSARFLFDKHPV